MRPITILLGINGVLCLGFGLQLITGNLFGSILLVIGVIAFAGFLRQAHVDDIMRRHEKRRGEFSNCAGLDATPEEAAPPDGGS